MIQIQPRAASLVGVAASLIAVVATVASSDGVRSALAAAYTYPNAQGVGLDEVASITLTYLFVISGAALVVGTLYFFVRPLSGSKAGWWLGGVLALVGLAVAIYNSTQAEFPLVVKIVYFLPPLAGVLWLALPDSGRKRPADVHQSGRAPDAAG